MAIRNPFTGSSNVFEFGLSERLSDALGRQRNAQGGSNLFGGQSTPQQQARNFTPVPASFNSMSYNTSSSGGGGGGGAVLGATTDPGGGGGSGGGRQVQASQAGAPLQDTSGLDQVQNEITSGIDGAVQGGLDALNQAEQALQAQTQQALAETTAAGQQQRSDVQAEQQKRLEAFGQQRGQAQTTTENAIAQARRQASELQQGIQSRFGGTTGTGQFASEILGRQALQNIAGNQQILQQTLGEINTAENSVREETARLLDQINQNVEFARERARNSLQSALADIAGRRGELQSNKANMRVQALQNYQQLLADIDARNTAFRQQLFQKSQEAANRINNFRETAIQRIQANPEAFQPVTFNTPGGDFAAVPSGRDLTGASFIQLDRSQGSDDEDLAVLQELGLAQ